MKSAWSDADAAATVAALTGADSACPEDLALRVYTSRLIGREPALVLHGGGNTSVKTSLADELGEPCEVLCVKGSGWDLGGIAPRGLPALRLGPLQALRRLRALDDAAMVNAARLHLLDASAPNPSVEVLLHAFLPHKFIDHSHADAILALVDQPGAVDLAREVFGDRLAVVPYVMPGFALAKLAAEVQERSPGCEGLLLLQHGLFTFGASARESYERHVAAVTLAEEAIAARRRARPPAPPSPPRPELRRRWPAIAPILRGLLGAEGRRYLLHLRESPAIRAFVDRDDLADRSGRGPITPDHVIRTKARPLVAQLPDTDDPAAIADALRPLVEDFRAEYRAYFARQSGGRGLARIALDPDPRVVLIPGLGICGAGPREQDARIAADLYEHTVSVIDDAEAVGRYQALPEDDLFDMEYWPLEQAKLGASKPAPLASRVVYITGAASGIGEACARAFAAAGAHLFLVDHHAEGLARVAGELKAAHAVVDVTDRAAVEASIAACVGRFGGVDGVVSNAGNAPQGAIATCPPEVLEASLRLNLLAHQWVASAAARVMITQGLGGFLLFNASKAAFNPGEGFGPYAIAKAGLVALMKQYALELGRHRIRASAVNADRIRTGLFPAEVVEARAKARGVDPGEYFRANLLHREVSASDVAKAFVHLALAESTTGAVLTVDGGNIAASPR